MHLIYLHGLDSSPSATKAQMVARCTDDRADVTLSIPDLNLPPKQVVHLLSELIGTGQDTTLIGSSLGGYFATLMSDQMGVPCVLLNPSIRPDVSFLRFLDKNHPNANLTADTVIYTTTGGWRIRYGDLAWFLEHRLTFLHPDKITALLKMGDELLDSHATQAVLESKGATVIAEPGGDHRMSDFGNNVAMVVDLACKMAIKSTNR